MRLLFVAALLWPVTTLADPSCERIYWGEVYDQQLGTEYGLLPLHGVAAEGTIIAARGADRDDPDAIAICPEAYTVLEAPRLMLSIGGALSKMPEDWGKNSDYYDGVVVHDPDGVVARPFRYFGTRVNFWSRSEQLFFTAFPAFPVTIAS